MFYSTWLEIRNIQLASGRVFHFPADFSTEEIVKAVEREPCGKTKTHACTDPWCAGRCL